MTLQGKEVSQKKSLDCVKNKKSYLIEDFLNSLPICQHSNNLSSLYVASDRSDHILADFRSLEVGISESLTYTPEIYE